MKNYKKIMVIGSGPITIGQGAEFDYSGTQACQVLKNEGYQVLLVNSNPATIMTDKEVADIIYSEPLTVPFLEKIIKKELPDALIAGMGGQTALNLALELYEAGILAKYDIDIIGTNIASIKQSEDRELFKQAMEAIQQPVLESNVANSIGEVIDISKSIGLPVVVRPAYTLGGTGGGIAETESELIEIAKKGLQFSMTGQVLIEKSIKGWKEIEYEMMRDAKGNVITVCNMENMDPVGIHTGDSIVVAPSQTLSDVEYQVLRKASIDIVNTLDIEGGCNVQLALDPNSLAYYIIEVNPRVSRSSSLASKATGYPIAKVATKIALGYSLDEIDNEITGKTKASFEPTLDYCVVKIPKWPFDKFKMADKSLGTTMMATGEVMAIGNTFESALLKAIRSLEIGLYGLELKSLKGLTLQGLFSELKKSDDNRLFVVAELIRRQVSILSINKKTGIDLFFLDKVYQIIQLEKIVKDRKLEFIQVDEMALLKRKGFSDKAISDLLLDTTVEAVYDYRIHHNIIPVYKMVDTCGGEFDAQSPYYYSTYDKEDEGIVSDKEKVIVIGSGPIRIGQGVEFDYCSVHGVLALKKLGYEAIIVNNNPETVSTDFDISDKLYFEPITEEDVMNIVEKEKPIGVILQFGGQTAIKLAAYLDKMNVPILGTSFTQINATEDRECFNDLMKKNDIPQPKGAGVSSLAEGIQVATELGYPLLVRPSYVIGGFGMEIVHNDVQLKHYLNAAFEEDQKNPVLIDQYMKGLEVEVDAICDGTHTIIPGIMEHLERTGVHSGDSISIYPPPSLSARVKDKIVDYSSKIGLALSLKGMFNIQYIVIDEAVYIIEVNPRSSRTVPFLSKVTGVPMIEIATKVILGDTLENMGYQAGLIKEKDFYAIKHPIFSMEKIKNTEVALGPEMKSTGEVMSIEADLNKALLKGLIASTSEMPSVGKAIVSLSDPHKAESIPYVEGLINLGYELFMTPGTYTYMSNAIECINTCKMIDHDKMTDFINQEKIELVVNMPKTGKDVSKTGFQLRRVTTEKKTLCLTSLDTFGAFVDTMEQHIMLENINIYNICEL